MASQSEGYGIQSNIDSLIQKSTLENFNPSNSKIVRPIPSKASTVGLSFIAPPSAHILVPSNHTSFKTLSAKLNEDTGNLTESNSIFSKSENINTNPDRDTTYENIPSESNKNSIESDSNYVPMENLVKPVKDIAQNDEKVIIDIASCDGPVKFRRVLNETYGSNINSNNAKLAKFDDNFTRNKQCLSSFHQQVI